MKPIISRVYPIVMRALAKRPRSVRRVWVEEQIRYDVQHVFMAVRIAILQGDAVRTNATDGRNGHVCELTEAGRAKWGGA